MVTIGRLEFSSSKQSSKDIKKVMLQNSVRIVHFHTYWSSATVDFRPEGVTAPSSRPIFSWSPRINQKLTTIIVSRQSKMDLPRDLAKELVLAVRLNDSTNVTNNDSPSSTESEGERKVIDLDHAVQMLVQFFSLLGLTITSEQRASLESLMSRHQVYGYLARLVDDQPKMALVVNQTSIDEGVYLIVPREHLFNADNYVVVCHILCQLMGVQCTVNSSNVPPEVMQSIRQSTATYMRVYWLPMGFGISGTEYTFRREHYPSWLWYE